MKSRKCVKPTMTDERPPTKLMRHPGRAVLVALIATLLATLAVVTWLAANWYIAVPADAQATYVGRIKCATCHRAEHQAWIGSDHDRAMELATRDSVLGDFINAQFPRLGVTTRFFMRDGKYFANAEGPDGAHHDF